MKTLPPVLCLAVLATFALGQSDRPSPAPATRPAETAADEKLKAIEADYQHAQTTWSDQYRATKTDAEREALMKTRPDPKPYVARCWDVVSASPGTKAAGKALVWILRNAPAAGRESPERTKALALLEKNHLDDDTFVGALQWMAMFGDTASQAAVEHALNASKNRDVRGNACFTLAKMLKAQARTAEHLQTAKCDELEAEKAFYGEDEVARLRKIDVAKLGAEAVKHFRRTVSEFGDVRSSRGTLGEAAASDLFELENLTIGKVAPDIVGEDIDGKPMKLSDFRGKVVVLDFWGNW